MEKDPHSIIDNNLVNGNAEEFVTFQSFPDRNSAMDFISLLEENHIEYVLDEFFNIHHPLFSVDKEMIKEFHVQLKKKHFPIVEELLLNIDRKELESIDPDYYLLKFTNDELQEVVIKSEEWSKFDYLLALKLLQERGVHVDIDKISKIKEERFEELAQPEKNQSFWIYRGYVLALTGGLLGIIIGIHMVTSKKTLPNGDRIYTHSETNRNHGVVITIIGTVIFVFTVFIKIGKNIDSVS